jgi:hypothetical protein
VRALFCEIIKGFHHYARSFIFSGLWAEFLELFWGFLQLQLLFLAIFPALGLVFGAVLEIFAVTATFLAIFLALGLNLGCCFKRFRDYSSPRSAYYAINPL